MVYDKSDKHLTIYDSYNAEYAVRIIKNIKLSNISDAYSKTNTMKFDTSNDTQKHPFWKQYVAWYCNEYITDPISDYINNSSFQELLLKTDYFGAESNKRVYIDLRTTLGYTDEIEKPS